MRKLTRKGTSSTTVTSDHHAHGYTAVLPIPMILSFLAYAIGWGIFTQLQIASTEQAVLGFLQSTIQVVPGQTVDQIRALVTGNLARDQAIATAIAWVVQMQILGLSFPLDRLLLASHQRDTTPTSTSVTRSAISLAKGQKLLSFVLIGADVVTDAMYVLTNRTVGTSSILGVVPIPSPAGWGIVLISLMYPVAICSATIFFSIQAAHRATALWRWVTERKKPESEEI